MCCRSFLLIWHVSSSSYDMYPPPHVTCILLLIWHVLRMCCRSFLFIRTQLTAKAHSYTCILLLTYMYPPPLMTWMLQVFSPYQDATYCESTCILLLLMTCILLPGLSCLSGRNLLRKHIRPDPAWLLSRSCEGTWPRVVRCHDVQSGMSIIIS